jgi:hypothetical protein
MKPAEIEARTRQISWPAPPADLRARVLSAVPTTSLPVSWSDRVWFSRGWRLAAAAAVLTLPLLESMSGPARSPAPPASAQAAAEARFVDETARQAGLSPEQAAALARQATAARRNARPRVHFGGLALEDFGPGGEPR